VLQFFDECGRSEGPVTADVDPSQKNHECHALPLAGAAQKLIHRPSCLPNDIVSMKDEKRAALADVVSLRGGAATASRQVAGRRTEIFGLGVVAYTPNPVGRAHPGVRHARKPGDPFGKGFSNLKSTA